MIAVPFRHPPAPPFTLLAATVGALALMPGAVPVAILCGLALAASLIAAIEGRSRAMLAATGIAVGLSSGGMILAPLIVGVVIRRRAGRMLPILPLVAVATWFAIGGWSRSGTLPSLYDLALSRIDLSALIFAAVAGTMSFIAAEASARPLFGRHLLDAAIASSCVIALFVPTTAAALILPLVVALDMRGARTSRIALAANDNRVVPRLRLAA